MDDLAQPQHHRSGAHRARRHPLLGLLLTLGAIGVVSAVLLWALLSLDVLGVGDELRQAGGASSAAPVDPSAPAAPPGSTAPATDEPTSADPGATTAATTAPTTAPTTVPTGELSGGATDQPGATTVDRAVPVDVLNSTATAGLAATATAALQELGWSAARVGDYTDAQVDSVVLHAGGSQEATARAVAQDLGIGTVTTSADVEAVTVVLGPDYLG